MVIIMTKMPSIQMIFRKDKDENYTKEALLYQDILEYSIKELEPTEASEENSRHSFKLWELTEWLILHNLEIAADYKNPSASHMTKTNKIQARIGRVKRHIDMLLLLGLIGEVARTRETKGDEWITLYSYTESGLLVALLVMTLNTKKRDKAIRFIYKVFCENFENNPSSLDAFSLSFINKLHKNNLFVSYVDTLVETLRNKTSILSMDEFFNNSLSVDLSEKDSQKFMKLRRDAFDELDPDMKRYFMYRQKLDVERKMFGVSTNLKGFEKLAFELRNDYENIAAEGYCKKCQLYFPVQLSLQDYLNTAYFVDELTATCILCKEENSILIPLFHV